MLADVEHFRGTRRSIVALICGLIIGFAASTNTALLLGVAWLLTAFAYAEQLYLAGELRRANATWTLGIAGLAGTLLLQQQYLTGTLLGLFAAATALRAWRVQPNT